MRNVSDFRAKKEKNNSLDSRWHGISEWLWYFIVFSSFALNHFAARGLTWRELELSFVFTMTSTTRRQREAISAKHHCCLRLMELLTGERIVNIS